jgi:hypothetical protein
MPKFKLLIASIFLFLMAFESSAQEKKWAFGARLGEPGGINIRRYRQENAFDLNIGTYGGIWGGYRAYRKGHYDGVGLAVNINYLWHRPLFKSEVSKVYYGFGPQFNNRKYYPKVQAQAQGIASLAIGANGIAGMEFFLRDSPLSIFLEAGLYSEIIPKPIFLHVQGGAGVRFNL